MKIWTYVAVISSQQNKSKKSLFLKSRQQAFGFSLASVLSIVLMFSDYHYQYLGYIRNGFSLLVTPLQYAVDYPVRLIGLIQALVSSKTSLVNENIRLHYQQTILESELQRLMAIKEENSELRQLLLTSTKSDMKAMAAQILAVETTVSRQLLILNKGSRDGVYVGQPVLDAKGVMGQIIDVGHMTSTVLLISDSKSAVPVRNNRSGEHGILAGLSLGNQLSLINLPGTSSVAIGDLLVTSGLGRLYPEGYPVGRVTGITHLPGEAFIKVDVNPVAALHKNRLVLLIWPGKEHAKLTAQINERIKAAGDLS